MLIEALLHATHSSKCGTSRPLQGDKTQKPLAKTRITRPFIITISSSTLSNLAYSFLPLLGKACGPFLTLPLQGPYLLPTYRKVYLRTPLSPTHLQVSRCTARSLLSLGYENRHDLTPRVGSPQSSWSRPTVLAASLISINFFFFFLLCRATLMAYGSVPRLGVWSELQLLAYTTAMPNLSCVCYLHPLLVSMPDP